MRTLHASHGLATLMVGSLLLGAPGSPVLGQTRSVTPAPASPTRSATTVAPAELSRRLQAHNQWAARVRTARGGGEVRLGASGEKDRGFQFALAVSRPSRLRLQGRLGNLTTLFDLGSNETSWTLHLPRQRQVVRSTDPRSAAGLLLAPGDVLAALLPVGVPPAALAQNGAASMSGEWLRLVVPPGTAGSGSPYHRVLYVDAEGRPRRVLIRPTSQLEPLLLEVTFNDYRGKTPFPHRIRIQVPDSGQWANFTFRDVKVNDELDERRFRVFVPDGTQEISLEQLDRDFLPEAAGE